jgi:hypothetical protein
MLGAYTWAAKLAERSVADPFRSVADPFIEWASIPLNFLAQSSKEP